jgi:hypothetical protein
MPIIYTPIAALHSGAAAASLGRGGLAPDVAAPVPLPVTLLADPLDATAAVGRLTTPPSAPPVRPLLTPDQILVAVEVTVVAAVGAGEPKTLRAKIGETTWTATDNAGATTRIDNDGRLCLEQRSAQAVGLLYTWTPVPAFVFSMTTLAEWAVMPSVFSVTFVVAERHRRAFGAAQWGGFADSVADPTRRLLLETALRNLSTRGGGLFPLQANVGSIGAPPFPPENTSQDSVLAECVFAGPSPYAAAWIDASDVGPTTTERVRIPADLASNNVAAYQRYPASFFRRPTFARAVELASDGVQSSEIRMEDGITTVGGCLCLYTTAVDLAASTWLLQIDGVAFRATILHDTFVGLRRPADIWNRVIVGAITRNGPLELMTNPLDSAETGSSAVALRGLLQRLEFLEFATFLGGFASLEGSFYDPFVAVAQAGATIPVP